MDSAFSVSYIPGASTCFSLLAFLYDTHGGLCSLLFFLLQRYHSVQGVFGTYLCTFSYFSSFKKSILCWNWCDAVDHDRHRLSNQIIYSLLTKQPMLQYISRQSTQLSLIKKNNSKSMLSLLCHHLNGV